MERFPKIKFPPNRLTEMTGPLKPRHAEFLQQLMAEYGGTRLTKVNISSNIGLINLHFLFPIKSIFSRYMQVLEKVKSLPEEVLDSLIEQASC